MQYFLDTQKKMLIFNGTPSELEKGFNQYHGEKVCKKWENVT